MAGGPKSKRQAWLEREIVRVGREIAKLSDENIALATKYENGGSMFTATSSPKRGSSKVLSAGQIDVSVEEVQEAGVKIDIHEEEMDAAMEDARDKALNGNMPLAGQVVKGSVLRFDKPIRLTVYIAAAAFVIAVLVILALAEHASHDATDGLSEHRAGGPTAPPLMRNIAVTLTSCGLCALACQLLQQPLILGYFLGGVLVGPIGLQIVESHVEIGELSSLGLIFLLFMIGLELDVKALLKMGKVVLLTGLLQFPICAIMQILIFGLLASIGLPFGTGSYAAMYVGMVCAISSTMIVVKALSEKGEMETQEGRLTIGILIFQDIWAITVLAIQPNLANPEIVGILITFIKIAILLALAMLYAKFVMPAMLYYTSKNLELMLVMSISWCFFIGCTAILPFVGLSMELASLIAGVALATFPYSAEFNGKIKYIRDFFITLFFAGLGMQIPVPSCSAIAMGFVVSLVVLMVRPLGLFFVVLPLGGGSKLGAISTLNLSQVSEFALVICSLGIGFGHINADTLTIIIWTFAILGIAASYIIAANQAIYKKACAMVNKLRGRAAELEDHDHDHDEHGEHRDIVLLGYHKVAFMMLAEIKAKSPQLLQKIHVIDFNQQIMPKLREIGVSCSYGDISCPDVLEHAFHGSPKTVICTIPDSMLRGISNEGLIKVAKQVWPECLVIVTADNPQHARRLYKMGADYVIGMAKLCAERLYDLLSSFETKAFSGGELEEIFNMYRDKDKVLSSALTFIESAQRAEANE